MVDKTGRELKPGMIVDIRLDRAVSAVVKEVHEKAINTPGGTIPPRITLQVLPFVAVAQDGKMVHQVYIIDEGKPESAQPEPSRIIQ